MINFSLILMLNQKCGDTCDMKGNSEFRLKTYLEDYMRHLQDHAKLRNFNDQTCGVSPFEDANKQSLKS